LQPDKYMHKRRGIFFGWIIVFISLTVTTTAFGVLYSFGVFFKGWLREWDCSRAFLSGVFSICFLMYGISSFFMGNLTDRYGPRKTLALGGFIMGAGAFLTSVVCQAWVLYITFGLMIGIGVGTSYSPTASTVSRWFLEKKGMAVGIVVSGLGLGTLIYSPLARFLIGSWNWRTTFVIFGMMIWTTYFTAAFILRKNPQDLGLEPYGQPSIKYSTKQGTIVNQGQGSPISPNSMVRTKDALREVSFWVLFFVHCCWVVGMAIPMVHLFPYATDIGIPPSQAAYMLAVLGGVSVLGRIALGSLGEKIGTRNSLMYLLLFQMVTMLWLGVSKVPWMLWTFSVLFGFSYGGLASIFPLITAEYFGLLSMGSIFGLILLGATLGGVIGPWVAGYLFDMTQKYSSGFLVGAGSMGTGVVLSLQLPRSISIKVRA
jgi:OFA family oxalate/formate antiporter-like MFS transporter